MKLRVTILGCGSSGGVPRPGGPGGLGNWGDCDPDEPRNRRMRCSIMVQRADPISGWDAEELTTLIVDTSPDLREQLLMTRCGRLDAVLYTHDHADQCHGVDDLRLIALNMVARVPVFVDPATTNGLLTRFKYCFEAPEGSYYPPILERKEMPEYGEWGAVDGPTGKIPFTPFLQNHGNVNSLGFVFGSENGIAYSSDVVDLPEESFDAVSSCQVWILDALRRKPHISHSHLDKSVSWLTRINPELGILTNMHVDMDYRTLLSELPDGIVPAYDGLKIEREFD